MDEQHNRQLQGCLLIGCGFPGLFVVVVICAGLIGSVFDSGKERHATATPAPYIPTLPPPPLDLPPSTPPAVERASETKLLQVSIFDDTKNNPIDDRAAIYLVAGTEWLFKNDARAARKELDARGARRKYGPFAVGEGQQSFKLFPLGQPAPEISIPFMMLAEMRADGSDGDSLIIAIKDDKLEIMGDPYRAATGNSSIAFNRRTGVLIEATKAKSAAEVEAELRKIFGDRFPKKR